ncbi:Gfo/Idh/MocA family oxidoreductase [Schumannella luteola]|uniref:Putative dehydrogenase n=1 Tax=Schumannella luteola TaxID=472059 RepID=A0A852YFH8_9MICO|nr:Gfo/Idh/MocA family oxidoreductase [Schumannella luteola]NYG98507.1 putative dehydrogenase [Schumannella luteola]TPX01269.1 Gfo/Idh/MocA family oxidoreductase [Schumannella luteola]
MTITATEARPRTLRVALIGGGLMARSHSFAYNSLPSLFPELGVVPELSILADVDDERARAAAAQLGFARFTSDWREAVTADDIDVVDIVTPNSLHFDIAMAAIAAGKHVYCEKPLAITVDEARRMRDAARVAGVRTIVGFSYLGGPGIQLAKQFVDDGTLGDIWQIKSHFFADGNADPSLPRTWHYERAKAGLGSLGDLGSHVISLVEFLGGPVDEVFGELATVVPERPRAVGALSYGSKAEEGAPLDPVENDDIATVVARLSGGARALIETSRVANGHSFDLALEIVGSKGSLRFSQQDSYAVDLFLRGEQAQRFTGTTAITMGPQHGDYAAYWPFGGVTLGLHEQKAIEVRNLFRAIVEGHEAYPSFEQGASVVEVLDAAQRSSDERVWVDVAR